MIKTALAVISAVIASANNSCAEDQSTLTRPDVSEQACPLEIIQPPTRDGQTATAVVRKPPGKGPFPAVILLHAGMGRKELERGVGGAKSNALNSQQHTRFLAAGYVTVSALRRGSKRDPQSPDSMADCLAIVDAVKRLPEVDSTSVAVFGHSGGGSLAFDIASETPLAAIVAGEPATVLFTGMLNRHTRFDLKQMMVEPRRFYTPELQMRTQDKIAKIKCPILICQGDEHPINNVNNRVFIPELKHAGKQVEVITYPGQPHSFFFGSRATGDAGQRVFNDAHAFLKKHLATQPIALNEMLFERSPFKNRPSRDCHHAFQIDASAAAPRQEKSTKAKQRKNGATAQKPKVKTPLRKGNVAAAPSPSGVTVLAFNATVRKPPLFDTWTTGEISPKPGQLILLWVGVSRTTGPVNVPTVSGARIEWKLEKTLDVNGGPRRLCLYSGISDAPRKGALTIDFDGQKQQRAFWAAIQFENASAVAQLGIAPDSTARDGSGEVIFRNPPTGPVAAFVIGSIKSNIVPTPGMHELGELEAVHRFEAAYSTRPQRQIQWTWRRGIHYIAIGAELEVAGQARRK